MGVGRIVALGVGAGAERCCCWRRARRSAGKYAVAQCGWHVGADAAWADTTGGAKFRPDAYCATPAGADPFDGAHLKSFTRDGQQTVSGTRFARWRWTAPPGTGIVAGPRHLVARPPRRVRAAARHATPATAASLPLPAAGATDATPARLRRRLLASPVGLRRPAALRPRREQVVQPRTGVLVGAAGADDHRRGRRRADRRRSAATSPRRRLAARAPGRRRSGARTSAPGSASARRASTAPASALTEYPCAKAMIGGEWRATTDAALRHRRRRRPDDRHQRLQRRAAPASSTALTDFAGNVGCLAPAHDPGRQQRRRPTRARPAWPAARAGGGSTTSTSPGAIPTRERRARSRAPTGGSPAPPATTAASSSPAGATSPRSPTSFSCFVSLAYQLY